MRNSAFESNGDIVVACLLLRISKPCSMTWDLRVQGVQCIPTVDSTILWTLSLQFDLQNGELVAKRRTAAMATLPIGEPRNGLNVLYPLTTDVSAIRRQGIINMT